MNMKLTMAGGGLVVAIFGCWLLMHLGSPVDLASPGTGKAVQSNYTLAVERPYSGAKFEPAEGAYASAYILQDEYIKADMGTFNDMTGKQHASFFKYVGYGQPFPTKWVEEVKSSGAVPHIAFEPNDGLDQVQDDAYLRQWAKDAKASGVPIFLRYAREMNGTWTQYSGHSEQYIEKWRLVYQVMKEEAPNVAMVWTVFTFPESTIMKFYPGDDYVDWVGVNVYNVVYHNDNIQQKSDQEDPLELLEYVYDNFSYKKPIQISEFGATHYTVTDDSDYPEWAADKIKRLYANLPTLFPRVKSIYYFDVNNLVNAPEGRKVNDYSITDDQTVLNAYKEAVSSSYYLSNVVEDDQISSDRFTFNGFQFMQNGKLYVDLSFYSNYLDLQATQSGDSVMLSDGEKSYKFTLNKQNIKRKTLGDTHLINGLPVREVAIKFGYQLSFSGTMIILQK